MSSLLADKFNLVH